MNFQYQSNRIYLEDGNGNLIAEVTFPECGGAVNINHTFVDQSLRGQGVAGKLMEAVAQQLREKEKKAVLTCSYAVKWFEQHPEYADILKQG